MIQKVVVQVAVIGGLLVGPAAAQTTTTNPPPVVPYPFFLQPMQRLLAGQATSTQQPQAKPTASDYYGNGLPVPPPNLPPNVAPGDGR